MVRFYDPKDESELARVEGLLRKGGVEYFLVRGAQEGIGSHQIQVAEEDLPHAEELVQQG